MKITLRYGLGFISPSIVKIANILASVWEQIEIFGTVVTADAVDMINHFGNFNESPKPFFSDKNMFLHVSIAVCAWMVFLLNFYISTGYNSTTFPDGAFVAALVWFGFTSAVFFMTDVVAKVVFGYSDLALRYSKGLSTVSTIGTRLLFCLFSFYSYSMAFLRAIFSPSTFDPLFRWDKAFTTDRTLSFPIFKVSSLIFYPAFGTTKLTYLPRLFGNKFVAALLTGLLFFCNVKDRINLWIQPLGSNIRFCNRVAQSLLYPVMILGVLPTRMKNKKVFRSVVLPVFVDMMNYFLICNSSTKTLFGNYNMFKELVSWAFAGVFWRVYSPVSVAIYKISTFPTVVVRAASTLSTFGGFCIARMTTIFCQPSVYFGFLGNKLLSTNKTFAGVAISFRRLTAGFTAIFSPTLFDAARGTFKFLGTVFTNAFHCDLHGTIYHRLAV